MNSIALDLNRTSILLRVRVPIYLLEHVYLLSEKRLSDVYYHSTDLLSSRQARRPR